MWNKLTRIVLVIALTFCTIPFVYGQSQAVMQNAAVANGNGTALNVAGTATAVLTVNCSSCAGGTAVNFEGTSDGTNYTSILGVLAGTTTTGTSTTTAGVGVWVFSTAGFQNVRARISAYSAGTVTVTGRSVDAPPGDTGAAVISGTITTNQGTSPWIVAGGGTAGSPGTAALTIQGISSGTAVPVTVPLSSAMPVMETDGTAMTIYAGTLSTLGDLTTTTGGTSANITLNTITINSLHCFNRTSSAATITRADSSGTVFQSAFSLPGNSDVYIVSPNAMEKQVGLALWAGTNSAIRCVMSARQ